MRTLNDFLSFANLCEHSYNIPKRQSHIVIDVLQFIYESLCKVSTDKLQEFFLNQAIPETIYESDISQINTHIFSLNFLDQIDKIYNLVRGKYTNTTIHKTQLVKAILDNTKNIIEKFLTTEPKYLPAYKCNQLISIVGDANNYNIVVLDDRQQNDRHHQVSNVLLNNPNLNENEAFFMPIMLISLIRHNKIYVFTHPNRDNKYYYAKYYYVNWSK